MRRSSNKSRKRLVHKYLKVKMSAKQFQRLVGMNQREAKNAGH